MSQPIHIQASSRSRRVWPLLAAIAASLLLAACGGTTSAEGELAQDQQILSTCGSNPPASMVAIDGTGSSATGSIFESRMTGVQSVVRQTAICSGDLRVVVFSTSSTATAPLFDGSLKLPGATTNARLLRVPALVSSVMAQVRKAYPPAAANLQYGGSDITAQYTNAAQWISQVGGSYRLHFYLLTDGFQNIGIDLGAQSLTTRQTVALADQLSVPKLPGASVIVAGLGHVAGQAPSSAVVTELINYYNELCHNTGAASCLSVSDYTTDGR